jgi:predicted permease
MLVKRPGTSALAVLALALGIGLTTTMFSIVYAAFLRGLPFERPKEIVYVGAVNTQDPQRPGAMTVHDFADLGAAQRSFETFAAFASARADIAEGDQPPTRYEGQALTPNALRVMRTAPVLGRGFTDADAEPGAPKVLILGYTAWTNQFQQAPDIVGRRVKLNGEPATIVGVMAEGFGFPQTGEVWTPLTINPPASRAEGPRVNGFGRLARGVSVKAATTELRSIGARLAAQYPENKNRTFGAIPFVQRYLGGSIVTTLSAMLAAVFGVLLIACVNVTNLQLARAADRTKEIAVRLAIGASRARLVRQLVSEGLLLAVAGALIGLAIAKVGTVKFTESVADTGKPFWIDVKIDPGVLLFVTAITLIAAIASSLVPALRVTRTALSDVLKDESRGGTSLRVGRFSRALIIAQMTLSFALLLGSGLMARSIAAISNRDFPFRTDVLYGQVDLTADAYKEDAALLAFVERLGETARRTPGVTSVAMANGMPGQVGGNALEIEGQPLPDNEQAQPNAAVIVATPSYLDALKIGLQSGRALDAGDRAGADPVVLVTPEFSTKYLNACNPIGTRIRLRSNNTNEAWRTIVGVTQSISTANRNGTSGPTIFVPFDQRPQRTPMLFVATAGAPLTEGALRQVVAAADPTIVVFQARTLAARYEQETWPFKVFGSLVVAFGLAALVLASAGLYGVMAFAVRRRLSEIGVRMALGATSGNILALMLKQGAWLVGIGMTLGAGLGIGLGRLLTQLLFGVKPWDPVVFAVTFLVLGTAALTACLVPARRAAAVDPLMALRRD